MHHRRPIAIAAALVALAAPLSACGFDYPTDRVNTIAAGVTDRSADIDALGIRVLSSEAGSGRLIGSLANNTDEAASLDSVTGTTAQSEGFEPIEIAAKGGINLAAADTTPVPLVGEFQAGEHVDLELTFSTGESLQLSVPVVKNCFQYTAVPTPSPSEDTEVTEGPEVSESAEATESAEETESEDHSDESHAEGGSAAYLCEHELEVEGH